MSAADAIAASKCLNLAREARTSQERIEFAEEGLAHVGGDQTTHFLLLRQRFLAELTLEQRGAALETAEAMCALRALHDVAQHDRARALEALDRPLEAIEALRLAIRSAPAHRRSFSFFTLGVALHRNEEHESAIACLTKGLRYAQRDRPLLKAMIALIELRIGVASEGLATVAHTLATSPCGEGYGRFVHGMLMYEMGDEGAARSSLRAFLRRNARIDPVKALSLAPELQEARRALATIESI